MEFQKSGGTYALQDLTSHKEEGPSLAFLIELEF